MTGITKYVEVEIDIDLDGFSDEQLQNECLEREIWPGATSSATNQAVNNLYHAYSIGKDITEDLRKLFYVELGRII